MDSKFESINLERIKKQWLFFSSDESMGTAVRRVKSKLFSGGMRMTADKNYQFTRHFERLLDREFIAFGDAFVDQIIAQGFAMYYVVSRSVPDDDADARVFYPVCLNIERVKEIRVRDQRIEVKPDEAFTRRKILTYCPGHVSLIYDGVPSCICSSLFRYASLVQTLETFMIYTEYRRGNPSIILETVNSEFRDLSSDLMNMELDVQDTARMHRNAMAGVDHNVLDRLKLQQEILRARKLIDSLASRVGVSDQATADETIANGVDPVNKLPLFAAKEVESISQRNESSRFLTTPYNTKVSPVNTIPPSTRSDMVEMRHNLRDCVFRSMGVPIRENFGSTREGVTIASEQLFDTARYYKTHVTNAFQGMFDTAFRNEEVKPRVKFSFPSMYGAHMLQYAKELGEEGKGIARDIIMRTLDMYD